MWITKFKIAILEKNVDSINQLLDEVPQFSSKEEAEQAMYLIREGMELVYTLQDQLRVSMKQMRRSIDFLKNSSTASSLRLNIKS